MSGGVDYGKDASSRCSALTNFCCGLTPGLILIDGDESVPSLAFAFEVAARMVECESANSIEVWSWKSFLRLCGVWLTGDSLKQIHCWELWREALCGAKVEAWLEERFNPQMGSADSEWLQNAHRNDWCSILGLCNDLVIMDFNDRVSFADMKELNKAAKACKRAVLACAELKDAQRRRYAPSSYAELAMRICIEHGVDFRECAETVVSLKSPDGHCLTSKFIRVCNDDMSPFELELKNSDPEEKRFIEDC